MNKEFEQKTENYEINFGKFFRLILMQSKLLIVVFLVIIFALAALFISSNRTYQIKSLLQVYSSSAGDIGSSVPSSLLMGSSNTSSIDNLIAIYDSRSNVIKLIDTLNLNLLAIKSDYQSMGLGKILLNKSLKKLSTEGIKFKYITCEAPTIRSLKFYKKNNFRLIGKKIRFFNNLFLLKRKYEF